MQAMRFRAVADPPRGAAFPVNTRARLAIAFVTLWGSGYPLMSRFTAGEEITIARPFYDQVNGPLFLALLLLMGVGPLLPWRRATPASLRGTNIVTSGLFMFARLGMLIIAGMISLSLLAETVLLVPVVFAATWTGTRFFRSSSPERFYAALQFMLLAMAAALVVRGILKIL